MIRVLIPVLCLALVSCGGSSPSSPPPPPPTGPTITISAGGVVSPREITVSPGTRVLFINNHTRSHDISSDPHPDHEDCPEIDLTGVLGPGQRRETGNLNEIRTCGFHDHDDPNNPNLQGRIIIR